MEKLYKQESRSRSCDGRGPSKYAEMKFPFKIIAELTFFIFWSIKFVTLGPDSL